MSARSHGISCTSFLVYSPDLPIQVTIAYLDFAVFGQLVPCTRLNIRFLFVEPRFRYVFLSPPLTEVSFDSRYRVHRQQVPQGNCTPDVQHARRTKEKHRMLRDVLLANGVLLGTRTLDPLIKSQLLYQLS